MSSVASSSSSNWERSRQPSDWAADPLSIVISTQAPSDADLLSTLIDDAATGADKRVKLFLFAADKDDDPWDVEIWRKANPALNDFRSLKDMEETAAQAQRLPAFEASFRNLFLNQRVAAENHFLSPSVWKLNDGAPDLSLFEDGPVVGGLDLSGVADMTSLLLVAQDDAGIVHVKPEFWVPQKDRARAAARRSWTGTDFKRSRSTVVFGTRCFDYLEFRLDQDGS